jgi:hypothetical protein
MRQECQPLDHNIWSHFCAISYNKTFSIHLYPATHAYIHHSVNHSTQGLHAFVLVLQTLAYLAVSFLCSQRNPNVIHMQYMPIPLYLTRRTLVVLFLSSHLAKLPSHKLHPSCEISGSHGGEYEMIVFWDIAPFSLIKVDHRFRGVFSLHHSWNFGLLQWD